MNENSEQQNAIRNYLLGNLTDKEKMRQIEEKLLLDDDFSEQVSIAEDELIDEYLDGGLDDAEKEKFKQFFLAASQRRQKLRFNQNLRKIAAKSSVRISEKTSRKKDGFWVWLMSPNAVRFAVVILLIAGFGFGVWRIFLYESDVEKGLAQMRIAFRRERPIESRTTVNSEYAPFSVTRGNEKDAVDEKALERAGRFLFDATENSNSARAHHALGLFYLSKKEFETALREFELALKDLPNDAKLNSDMGAALFEKAKKAETLEKYDETMENLALSLKSLNRALDSDANLLEALFNKALVLQKMRLANQAEETWEKYLEKDSASPWADEARKNLELLKRQNVPPKDKSQILRDFLEAFRNRDDTRAWEIVSQTKELITGVMIQPQLAEKFLEASLESRTEETAEILSAFSYLGELEKKNTGDPYFSEIAEYYSKTNRSQRQKLLEAHRELQDGYKAILIPDFQKAVTVLHKVKKMFAESGNVWEALIADYQISYCLTQLDKINESNRLLFSISEHSEKKQYIWIQTLSTGWLGSNYSLLGEHSKAINFNQKSLENSQKISNLYDLQKSLSQLANEYLLIGDAANTLHNIYRTLLVQNTYFLSPRQKNRNLIFATDSFYRFTYYDAAAAFGNEEVRVAQENRDKFLDHTARNHLAMIWGKEQKYEEAFAAIEQSFRLSESFEDEVMRKRLSAKNRLILANIQKDADRCGESVENFDRVIEEYGKMEFSINNYAARKGRLLCYIAEKNDSAVIAELPELIKSFDENRQKIAREAERNIFFDNEQGVYDIAADYAYSRLNDSEQAFNYLENSRARSLLGLIASDEAKPFDLREIRPRIPEAMQVVYYAVLADKILIWHLSRTNYFVTEVPLKAGELNEKIEEYTRLLVDKKEEELKDAAKELYTLLIRPVAAILQPDKPLCIIGDKMLFRLSFASLISPELNRYLIEDHALLYAPSATIFINETEIAGQKVSTDSESVLSIGNPAFARRDYPELADLPSAKKEAEQIAAFYDSAKILVEKDAVKDKIKENLANADVVNFAGHYVPNSKSPALSRLLLASGDLSVEEIMRNKLPRTRLMILSACESGVERFYNGEGMIGAARAFLAADVPLVVASQWSVDSEATAELMIKFHRYRKKQNLQTIDALRQAQIDLLNDVSSSFRQPFYWAGFLSVGGYADY